MAKLTDKKIQKLEPPEKGKRFIFDEHREAPQGFGVRILASGTRSFVLRYYSRDGKDRIMTIGKYPAWTLAAARKRASELRREIDGGTDILKQRRVKRAENTVADIVEKWCQAHADKLKSGKAVRGTVERHLVPALGDAKITEVRRRDFIQLLEGIAESTPRQASLLLTYCKQIMTWAEDRELIEYNPIATLTAKRVAENMKTKIRTRVLDDDEIRRLWQAEKVEGMSRAILLALKFILITGQRPGEVSKATQDEIRGTVWIIPKEHRGKTEDEHIVPLTDSALDVLKQAAGERFLFERFRGQGMDGNALAQAVRLCREVMNNNTVDPWKPHDLRRTMRTGLAAAGISETVAELAVGHVRKGIEAVYDQHRYEREIRAALEAWERRLLRIVAGEDDSNVGEPDSNVIEFGARA